MQNSSGTLFRNRSHLKSKEKEIRNLSTSSKISDNKTKTESPKIANDLFNTTKAIEQAISNIREKLHAKFTVTDISEKNEIVERDF